MQPNALEYLLGYDVPNNGVSVAIVYFQGNIYWTGMSVGMFYQTCTGRGS